MTGTALVLSFTRRDDGKVFTAFRGQFACGGIFLNDYHCEESMRGWYAHTFKQGRQSRQKKPSLTPADAALKMWGPQGRDLIAAFSTFAPLPRAALNATERQ